ncbi:diguanylate cyclase [Neptuniibacter sp.]|uniref:sensor domain-containing diguanylate cyclase n=1 Tax=Neptuniibacter sp. TaxID=1962643 RepID=UPI00261618CD|nr:diguanylate cyclase [Neptuniibacter sp.]MCP4596873.1 GGDEF domain-containing protein [Neptuniibacter sp.]
MSEHFGSRLTDLLHIKGRTFQFSCLLMLFLASSLSYANQEFEDGSIMIGGTKINYIKEKTDTPLSYQEALIEISNRGMKAESLFLNFGLGSDPVWLSFEVANASEAQVRYLQIETTWLDKLEVYFLHDRELLKQGKAGDHYPYHERELENRFFTFKHSFPQGKSTILIRVESIDPLALPIYLYSQRDYEQRKYESGYIYGTIYGFLIALMIYNAMLSFSLKSRRYLFYSLYLAMFILLNIAYTGHGYRWFWPNSPVLQNKIIPVLMSLYVISGLLFAVLFLESRNKLPGIHKVLIGYGVVVSGLTVVFTSTGLHLWMLYTVFIGIVPFALLMITAGAVACFNGAKEARYFLCAAVFATISAVISALTVSGAVGYSPMGFHAVEYGMLLEAVLFALALAYQFRLNQEEKTRAERLADRDQLTGLYNRRGFDKVMEPIFSNACRNQRNLCLMVMDIDHFKKINDSLGHNHGDLVLKNLSNLLLRELRHGDIVARWGGEEFVLLLPETDHYEAVVLAERLVNIIAHQEVSGPKYSTQYTVSIGIAELSDKIRNFNNLLNEADHYLYKAKESGRNRVCYQSVPLKAAKDKSIKEQITN